MLASAGEDIRRGFELRDFLDAVRDDAAFLRQRLEAPPRIHLQQCLRPSAEGWQMTESLLELDRGPAYTGKVDPSVANLVMRCDGRRPPG